MIFQTMLVGEPVPCSVTHGECVQDACPDKGRHLGLPGWELLQQTRFFFYKEHYELPRDL